jgi:hypothetical protein
MSGRYILCFCGCLGGIISCFVWSSGRYVYHVLFIYLEVYMSCFVWLSGRYKLCFVWWSERNISFCTLIWE